MGFERRKFIRNVPILSLGAFVGAAALSTVQGCAGPPPLVSNPDGHGAVPNGPLLTAQQHDVDQLALHLLNDPAVLSAREKGLKRWAALPVAQLPGAASSLNGAVDEAVYLAVRSVAAGDAAAPQVIWTSGPGYSYGTQQVPGSCWGGDNPDRIYRSFAAAPAYRYTISGRRDAKPSNKEFSFETIPTVALGPDPLAALNAKDIDIAGDGSFTITVDSTPANGRRNHLSLPPGAKTVLIRDTLADWTRQLPNHLAVTRADGAMVSTARTNLGQQTAAEALRVIDANAGFINYAWSNPVNGAVASVRTAKDGVAGSAGALSRFSLKPEQALVFTIIPGTASYASIQLTDPWFRSIPYRDHTSSLSNRQAKPNPDGSITFIASLSDPGYYNWLDPAGVSDGLYMVRVEDFGTPPQNAQDVARPPEIVDLSRLPAVLSNGTPRITSDERAEQLAQRTAGYDLRLAQ
jgi:hypothetical protein